MDLDFRRPIQTTPRPRRSMAYVQTPNRPTVSQVTKPVATEIVPDSDKVTISIRLSIPAWRLPRALAVVRKHPKLWLLSVIIGILLLVLGGRHFWQAKHQLPVAFNTNRLKV